jgi:hypothetical protein
MVLFSLSIVNTDWPVCQYTPKCKDLRPDWVDAGGNTRGHKTALCLTKRRGRTQGARGGKSGKCGGGRQYHIQKKFACAGRFPLECVPTGISDNSDIPQKTNGHHEKPSRAEAVAAEKRSRTGVRAVRRCGASQGANATRSRFSEVPIDSYNYSGGTA